MTLKVVETYQSIQGEGPFAGVPSIFIRLAHCNLACFWCDAEFDTGKTVETVKLVQYLVNTLAECGERLIVITGGEPMLHPLGPFLHSIGLKGMSYQIETAGGVKNEEVTNKIQQASPMNLHLYSGSLVVSPKGPAVREEVSLRASGYKYVIRAGELDEKDGLPNYSAQTKGRFQPLARPPKGYPPRAIYLQPCDDGDAEANHDNLLAAWESCQKHGYRLSIQQRKLLGMR